MEKRLCLACGEPLIGRTDKRYCDDGCRSLYNNKLNSKVNNFVRLIDRSLKKNRRILESTLGEEKMVKVSKEKLLTQGFRTDLFTSQLQTSKGQIYFFVYEYGYLPLDNDLFLIVKQREG